MLSGIDIVVNSAGIVDEIKPAVERSIEVWQRIIDVNFRGTFLISRTAARYMMEQRGGSIINIASVNGPGGWPRRTAYGPSKASIIALTKELACEWGNAGIGVNAVGPAYITTPMVEGLIKEDKIDVERLCNRTPLNRLGGPEEVARAMAEGGLRRSIAKITVSVTGIAGPGGGTKTKPVGLVHFACAYENKPTSSYFEVFSGDRSSVREATVLHAFNMIETSVKL